MRVQVKINLGGTASYVIGLSETHEEFESNVSNISKIFDSEDTVGGYKGFQLADNYTSAPATLNGSYKFFDDDGYPGFLSNIMSSNTRDNTDDDLAKAYTFAKMFVLNFYIQGTYPEHIYLTFDTVTGEHAENFLVSYPGSKSKLIENNRSSVVTIPIASMMPTENSDDDTIMIYFVDWSAPCRSIQITNISAQYNAVYTGSDLIKVTCSENLLDSQMKIAPGIVEQYAEISIYDRDEMLHSLALRNELMGDYKVNVTAIDDTTGNTFTMGAYTAASWDISSENSVVNVSCRDPSYMLDKINVPSIPVQDRTVDDMLNFIFSNTGSIAWQYIDQDTQDYCQKIYTPDSWFYAGTLLSLLKKVCTLGMLRIYWSVNKYIVARCY